ATGPSDCSTTGPVAAAPDGTLLIGDPKAAKLYAVEVPVVGGARVAPPVCADLLGAIAATAGTKTTDVTIGDLVVDQANQRAFVTASVAGEVCLFAVAGENTVTKVSLDKTGHSVKQLANPPEDKTVKRGRRSRNRRNESITDIAFQDGKVLVSGLSAGASPSRVLELAYPFAENDITTSVEIFHAAHGRVEDATIRTFVPMVLDGKPTLLAGFTCTPLVRFRLDDFDGGDKVRGTTVAELGNWNTPLDIIVYQRGEDVFLLMNNTARGVMKINTQGLASREGLDQRVPNGGTAGQPFEKIEGLDGVAHMAKWDDKTALVIAGTKEKPALRPIPLP
ncbi:MAG: hypothetical protein AAFP69_00640, partial [Planctomycetota bacterium]